MVDLQLVKPVPEELIEWRPALRAHCYRMLGHPQDADDAVQDTFVRAVRALDGFEGRSSLGTWLTRIATRVCLDVLSQRDRRRMPTEQPLGGSDFTPTSPSEWVAPIPSGWLGAAAAPPDEQVELRHRVDLALVAMLQKLPPRQRAALLLAEVFDWTAPEVAALLDSSVASVNSALQRARAKLHSGTAGPAGRSTLDPEVVHRYQEAFARYDVDALVGMLAEDVVFDMPPIPTWFRGREDVRRFLLGPGAECRGSKLVSIRANGGLGFAQYRHGGETPWGLVVLETRDGEVCAIHTFLEVQTLFPLFGLPMQLTEKNSDEVVVA